MRLLRKWWKLAVALVVLVIAAQIGVSLLMRTPRMHSYLTAQLERAFGRPVQVGHFAMLLLPVPQFDAERVTVGDDPAFGNEYFLRADHLSASLRWSGLLRGHFEFGTLSFSRPSLTLVRNAEGKWNLERWLPPAKTTRSGMQVYGPAAPAAPAQHLWKLEFDGGRINFKNGDEKLAFALSGVSGSVNQISPGRWQMQLKAQPWRSGVVLQSAGTLNLQGNLAGTSARLQPARITLHWEQVSLADFLRLVAGRDYGVRGVLSLAGTLRSSAMDGAARADAAAGIWAFSAEARAEQVHRWDLTERNDNPRMSLNVNGVWNVAAGSVHAERFALLSPRSNLRGTAECRTGPGAAFEAHLDSAGVQASDLLGWYRAFTPGVDEQVSAEQFFTGVATLQGWPLQLTDAAFSSNGGTIKIPGLKAPIRVGALRGGRERNALTIEPVRVALGGAAREVLSPKKRRIPALMENAADITLIHDLQSHAGSLSIEGHVQKAEDVLKAAEAIGHPLNHGWELTGEVLAVLRRDWPSRPPLRSRWNGRILFSKSKLAVAGLNQPLDIQAGTLNWKDGQRSVEVTKVNGFGGAWAGTITERIPGGDNDEPKWSFDLTTDRMNASELDRWVGPRARPSWLKRLLTPLLGSSSQNAAGSELLRQVNAEGQLNIGELTIEKLKLTQVRVPGALRNFHVRVREAEAHWAGGLVRAEIDAGFAPLPAYDVTALLENVNVATIPASSTFAGRFAGLATGKVHLTTAGIGRDDLLQNLAGSGSVQLSNVEFRGWDVDASVADGAPHAGISQWTSGRGAFTMRNRSVVVESLTLQSGREETSLQGTVTFTRDADLTVQSSASGRATARSVGVRNVDRVLKIFGPLEGPRVSVERVAARQPAD